MGKNNSNNNGHRNKDSEPSKNCIKVHDSVEGSATYVRLPLIPNSTKKSESERGYKKRAYIK